MPFTTIDLVKKHILEKHLGANKVENERVRLTASDYEQLSRRIILTDSERIKAKEQNEPTLEAVSFSGGDSFTLSHNELIPDTVVMASDSSLGTTYIENTDFAVDYDSGQINRLSSGSIPSGAQVVAWYLYYRVYERGVDYDLDFMNGQIRRRSSGDIESGQWIFADFTAATGGVNDDVIENSISEANNMILDFIDSSFHESSDRLLVDAETFLAVSLICKIRGIDSLSDASTGGSGDSQSWAALSEIYRMDAYNILAQYAGSIGTYNTPSKA